jgi:restriction system protein
MNSPNQDRYIAREEELRQILNWWSGRPRQPLLVTGPGGIGKSTLIRAVVAEVAVQGGAVAFGAQNAADCNTAVIAEHPRGQLFVMDGVDEDVPTSAAAVRRIQESAPKTMILAAARSLDASQRVAVFGDRSIASIQLERLGDSHLEWLIAEEMPQLSLPEQRRIAELSDGSPLAIALMARLIEQEDVGSVLARLPAGHDGRYSGQLGPEFSGLRVDAPLDAPRPDGEVDIRVRAVNQGLIDALATRPELMHELRPRQFEELMAELYVRQGFEVELTPETRDGGVDLYVIRHESFGPVVTLVDAKRHTGKNRVGVGVVRQLYGIVEAKNANAGVIATTSFFSRDAQRFTEEVGLRMRLQNFLDVQKMLQRATKRS